MMCLKEKFQSTYLYKVRLKLIISILIPLCFNPRTYIRYDSSIPSAINARDGFNPRTYIRYDTVPLPPTYPSFDGFNPRTYIRYDLRSAIVTNPESTVSIHVPI